MILRAGLIESANTFDESNVMINDKQKTCENSTSLPISTNGSSYENPVNVDKCAILDEIMNCTQEEPYCFVDGNILECGSTNRMGWRISPLDGLVLNHGQKPNSNCKLFNPPDQPSIKTIILELLSESAFGLGFKGRESAVWYNSFDYLGNCPLETQFCDKDLLICKNLFDSGKECSSSNQCFTRFCGKRDMNDPDDTTERVCVDNDEGITKKKDRTLTTVSCSVGFTMLFIVTILFIGSFRKKTKILFEKCEPIKPLLPPGGPNYSQSEFIAKHLSALHPNLTSKLSLDRSRPSSKNTIEKRETCSSDSLSVLLPPPPTISRDISLYYNPYINNFTNFYSGRNVSQSFRDSFDIYLAPYQTV
ncbi:3290_t:CDS:1 [Funneliformis geosporum]|uniref:1566_t:CDS:1 n=1 Tax=Funneliformis geosporum TaxID=1117311 RepID=A0A9W4WSE5_9GLOM|nr:3290_t:CDS:1 [Funneliformis geosporum]CAI2168640.1 1566_t:CDS:1 [Funneliformis geosporum]